MPTHDNIVSQERRRGWSLSRTTNRDDQRDAATRKIFEKPGFAADVARHLGVTHQSVSQWNRVPARHVIEVARMLKMRPEEIRPDVFGRRRK